MARHRNIPLQGKCIFVPSPLLDQDLTLVVIQPDMDRWVQEPLTVCQGFVTAFPGGPSIFIQDIHKFFHRALLFPKDKESLTVDLRPLAWPGAQNIGPPNYRFY